MENTESPAGRVSDPVVDGDRVGGASKQGAGGAIFLQVRASKLARELQSLHPRARQDLGAVDELLVVLDVVVLAAQTFLDEQDTRHWPEKLQSVLETFSDIGEAYGPRIADFLLRLDEEALSLLAKKYARKGYVDHVRRMVGEGSFRRLHVAVSEDCDVIAAAVYKGVEALMPYAVALSDLADLLTEEQIAQFMDFNPAGGFMLEVTFAVFDLLDLAVDKVALPEHLAALPRQRSATTSRENLLDLTAELRAGISGNSRTLVKQLNTVLDRKLQGARDALSHSVDSVSQAANSLIEFIDRLLRTASTNAEVLAWLEDNYTDTPDLTYIDLASGRRLPTKRGQALCLLYGGQPVADRSPFHLLAATSLNATRKRLQSLKHADLGTADERDQVAHCMAGIEAFMHIASKFAWPQLPDDTLRSLKSRFDSEGTAIGQTVPGEVVA